MRHLQVALRVSSCEGVPLLAAWRVGTIQTRMMLINAAGMVDTRRHSGKQEHMSFRHLASIELPFANTWAMVWYCGLWLEQQCAQAVQCSCMR